MKYENDDMFITIDLHINRIQDARYKYTEKNIKHYSFSDSIHGKGGTKPKLKGPFTLIQ